MKKIIATIVIILSFGFVASAQTDRFFKGYSDYRNATENEELPGLPTHGLEKNIDAPLGSGLFLLAAMGLAYGVKRTKNSEL